MYRNLNETLKKLNIKKRDLADLLGYSSGSKTLSIRINGSTRFTDGEKEKIYSYLVSKGYSGSKEELFHYSEIEKKEKSYSRLSQIIKDGMKKQKLKNQDLADLVGVSVDTIDAWRNGRVTEIRSQYLDSVSKALNLSPLYLLGDESKQYQGYVSSVYSDYELSRNNSVDAIFKILMDEQYNRGYKKISLSHGSSSFEDYIKREIIPGYIDDFSHLIDIINQNIPEKMRTIEKDLESYKDEQAYQFVISHFPQTKELDRKEVIDIYNKAIRETEERLRKENYEKEEQE